MSPRSFEERLRMLEQEMQQLRTVPGRLAAAESQIVQLRTEVRDGFSAIRADLRAKLQDRIDALRLELYQVRDELREDTRVGVEETQRLMRLLHEDLIERIARIRE